MDARFNRGQGLTRPELAVLMAYAKLYLYEAVLNSDLPDDPFVHNNMLPLYFPESLRATAGDYILNHPLHREISATMIVNNLINRTGVNFIGKIRAESDASVVDVVKAYLIVAEAYQTESLFALIEARDKHMSAQKQTDELRCLVAEIEKMTLAVLRDGMEKNIADGIKIWKEREDKKFLQFRDDFAV